MSDWDSLPSLEAHLWRRLDRAVRKRDDPWRFVTLATLGTQGPEARVVGLRGADRAAATVEIHTDARTPKVGQLTSDPRAQVLLWDAQTQEQLRLTVDVAIVAADPRRWSRVPDESRGNYGTDPAPGTPLNDPEGYSRTPDAARFAALVGHVTAMDAVWLAPDPHRRAQMRDGRWSWVAP